MTFLSECGSVVFLFLAIEENGYISPGQKEGWQLNTAIILWRAKRTMCEKTDVVTGNLSGVQDIKVLVLTLVSVRGCFSEQLLVT